MTEKKPDAGMVGETAEPVSEYTKALRIRMGQCTQCGEMPDECGCKPAGTPGMTARELFEKWIREEARSYSLIPADPECGTYKARDTDALWKAWQAASQSAVDPRIAEQLRSARQEKNQKEVEYEKLRKAFYLMADTKEAKLAASQKEVARLQRLLGEKCDREQDLLNRMRPSL